MQECLDVYKVIAFFIRKAMPVKATRDKLGLNDIEKARKSQYRMIGFMKMFIGTCARYRDRIIASGCNAGFIDRLPKLLESLETSEYQQERFKKDRIISNSDRIQMLNILYDKLIALSQIAKMIYGDDPRRDKYLMPQAVTSTHTVNVDMDEVE